MSEPFDPETFKVQHANRRAAQRGPVARTVVERAAELIKDDRAQRAVEGYRSPDCAFDAMFSTRGDRWAE